MDDLDAQMVELEKQGEERRIRFLQTELQVCWTALDFGHTEIDLGARTVGEHEVEVIEIACQTMLKFLPTVNNEERRNQFAEEIAHVQVAVRDLKKRLWREAS